MTIAIACVSGKGGVGKTTTACNLAAAISATGRRVLAVDVDPQSNLTSALGHDPYALSRSITDVVAGRHEAADAIVPTCLPDLFLLPSSPVLAEEEQRMGTAMAREHVLREALLPVRGRYDVIVFDTPPAFGFDTINALAAADRAVVPVQLSGFAINGLKEVLRVAEMVRTRHNPGLRVLGVVLSFVNPQVAFNRDLAADLRGIPGLRVFATTIPTSVRLQEAAFAGLPVREYAPASRASRAYARLAEEVIASG